MFYILRPIISFLSPIFQPFNYYAIFIKHIYSYSFKKENFRFSQSLSFDQLLFFYVSFVGFLISINPYAAGN